MFPKSPSTRDPSRKSDPTAGGRSPGRPSRYPDAVNRTFRPTVSCSVPLFVDITKTLKSASWGLPKPKGRKIRGSGDCGKPKQKGTEQIPTVRRNVRLTATGYLDGRRLRPLAVGLLLRDGLVMSTDKGTEQIPTVRRNVRLIVTWYLGVRRLRPLAVGQFRLTTKKGPGLSAWALKVGFGIYLPGTLLHGGNPTDGAAVSVPGCPPIPLRSVKLGLDRTELWRFG